MVCVVKFKEPIATSSLSSVCFQHISRDYSTNLSNIHHQTMRFSLIVASLFSAVGLVSANSIIHENKSSSCAETRFGCPATPAFTSARNNLDTALSLRGGEVQEPTTLQEVEDILMKASAEGKLVVIDFSAVWCGPCKMIAPLYHELSEMSEFSNIVFLKVDVDENPDTAMKFQVSAMPTFLFIKSGQVVDKMMGANPAKLKDLLEELA